MDRAQIRRAFETVMNFPPREADIAVIELMGADVETMAEYIWDHWMGEPDQPTVEEVEQQIEEAITQ